MKKFIAPVAFLSLATISPVSAASWTSAIDAAIATGHYDAINQVVAANPGDAGAIAAFLLQQAQNDAGTDPGKAVKLLNAATPLAPQIPQGDAGAAVSEIQTLITLANNPGFQKKDPKGAASIFSNALGLSSLPGVAAADPALHGLVVADAADFLKDNPDDELKDDVLLAQGNDLNGVNPDPSTIRIRERNGTLGNPDIPSSPPPPVSPPPSPPSAE